MWPPAGWSEGRFEVLLPISSLQPLTSSSPLYIMFGIIINCILGQKRIKSPSGNLGEMLVMMVACQVVQQEMDVEVVSRLEIICISQVSTTTRNDLRPGSPRRIGEAALVGIPLATLLILLFNKLNSDRDRSERG